MATVDNLRRAMSAAERTRTNPPYKFEDDDNRDDEPKVIQIPTNLDQKQAIIRQMMNHQVTVQAERSRFEDMVAKERDRLEKEESHIDRELRRHRIAMSREMLLLGISAPMANEEIE